MTQNRGVPPDYYSPESKARHAIAHYVLVTSYLLSAKLKYNANGTVESKLDWTLRQFDVKNAFLHGELEEEVYMSLPPGYMVTGETGNELRKRLASEFEMKYLGSLKYFLGMEYVMDLLADTEMFDCKPADTPTVENHKLERYQRLVGRLIYLSLTHPDIAYAISVASQFMHSPSEDHMVVVMHILSYLKFAPGRGLLFKKNGHLDLEGYTGVDYARNITDRRSTSGYFTFVGGNLVTWRRKKQNIVSRSSAESEYKGIAQGVCEILWLRPNVATKLHCDNQSAFEIANNLVQHDQSKLVEVYRHFIQEKLEHKLISIPFVPSLEQLADMLTHAVSKRRFEDSLNKLGITDIYAPT
ncbi:hypothetical protein Prudu_1459S001500 [Prunus dulcis]|uniref:Reverse transcriptase Ty1/copia-type domain-containing protein n=1 Tax=Prunus dulcis TaxID=3755 RepID=A0A5H2XUK3_PRUDU|nr:hypothetical protein Prudu_1459S001500 [Prunus dulcis]